MDYKTITEGEWDNLIDDSRNRFWSNVYRWGDKCWLWAGSIKRNHHHPNGHPRRRLEGIFSYRGKKYLAHRFSYLLEVGNIPEGYEVHHTCGEPLCVRPEHLKAVPYADHLREHSGEGRRVPTIVRVAMEQLSREEANPNLYTEAEKTRRWAYLRYHIRLRKTALLFDGYMYNWPSATGNITEDRG